MSEAVLQVFVFRSGAYVGSELFLEPELVVGSGDGADLKVQDREVGDAHAIVAREGTQVTVLDLGHSGGTRVNGRPVRHAVVTSRDEIGVGGHILKLKLVRPRKDDRQQPAPPRPRRSPPPATADLLEPAQAPLTSAEERVVPTEIVRERQISGDVGALIEEELHGSGLADFVGRAGGSGPPPAAPASSPSFGSLDEALASAFGEPSATPDRALVDGLTEGLPATQRAFDEVATVAAPLQGFAGQGFRESGGAEETSFDATPADGLDLEDLRTNVAGTAGLSGSAPVPQSLASSFLGEQTEATPFFRAEIPDPFGRQQGAPEAPFIAPESPRSEPAPPPPPVSPQADPPIAEVPGADPLLFEEELDPEEAEAHEPPGFSLLEELVRQPRGQAASALEVIASDRGEVRSVAVLEQPRQKLTLDGALGRRSSGLRLAAMSKPGEAEVRIPSDAAGVLFDGPNQIPVDELKVPAHAVSKKSDAYAIRLRRGQSLTLRLGEAGFHLRFVDPPALPPAPKAAGRFMEGPVPRVVGLSVLAHVMVALLIVLTTPEKSFSKAREVWAEVNPDDVRTVELPPPEPEPEPEPVVAAPEPEPKPRPQKRRRTPPPSPTPKPRRGPKGKSAAVVKKAGVLGALGKIGQRTPGKKSMVAAVSNIDAVKAPGGSSYRVGAIIGKAPTSKVRLGGGGGGKRLTRGSANLLKGGTGFARIGKKSGAKVRGRVSRAVARKITAKGNISRQEVQKVINEHLPQVQSCYERALIANPGLRGKLTIEWTIRTNGRVSGVKQKFSTLQGPQVASCIMGKLKGWRFPKPRGGVVVVSYPFNFAPTSY